MESLHTEKRRFSRQEVALMLTGTTALAELPTEAAYVIVGYMEAKRIKPTGIIIQEGFINTAFMGLLLQGEAVVENELARRTDSMVITTLGAGALIGELGLIDGQPRSATVRAITEVDMAVLEREALSKMMKEQPSIACLLLARMLADVSQRLRVANKKMLSMHRVNRSMQSEMGSLYSQESKFS
jgi:CRP/FNR family transcriptional regulator, cyclic AMP receptor protein